MDETELTGDETFEEGQPGGEEPGSEAGGVGAGAGGTPPPPAERTFTQAQVEKMVQDRLARDRQVRERAARQQAEQAAAEARRRAAGTPAGFDPRTQEALQAYLEPIVTPLREAAVKGDMDRAFSTFEAAHPEFKDKGVRDEVINIILSWGKETVDRAPMDWLLTQGWLQYKYGNFDEKAFRAQVEKEYVDRKSAQARKTPVPQGAGGRSTTSPKQGPKTIKDANAAMEALIREESAARA